MKKFNHIPSLKGLDLEIFNENLNKELTQKEIDEVRKWVKGDKNVNKN